ncbi:MAG TPA: hypothetical protein VFB12_01445 [Ktedonobacteraceae bacterium]|nr:hypothetical protein [Ktedonobacteraceae bacterium]
MIMEKFLLRLYPRTWRACYEEEFLAMLESRPLSLLDSVNIVYGALDAHLHPHLGMRGMPVQERSAHLLRTLRQSVFTIFSAYISFVIGGIVYGKMTEETVARVMQASALAGASYIIVFAGSIIALLAVLIGGLPLAFATIKRALTGRRISSLLLLTVPLIAYVTLFRIPTPPSALFSRGIFPVLFLVEAAISTAAVCVAIARSEIDASLFRFAALPALVATTTMNVMLVATLCWGVSLYISAPSLFIDYYGFMQANTAGLWVGVAITMTLSTSVATLSLVRALSVRSALDALA